MKTQEILTIIALSALGLCLLCGLAKMAMKNPKKRSDCDKACGALFFVAVALMAVGQLLGETHTTSSFEMGAEGKKPENCVMKASSVANEYKKGQMAKLAKARNNVMKKGKEIYDKELAECKAGGHSKPHRKHHKHHNISYKPSLYIYFAYHRFLDIYKVYLVLIYISYIHLHILLSLFLSLILILHIFSLILQFEHLYLYRFVNSF